MSYELLRTRISPLRERLISHEVYQRLQTIESLRLFMQYHVFAVWDFMSLLKALQQRLCSAEVPWLPPANALACRFVNEIMLNEESDEDGSGGFASHFSLYLSAMQQCGADTRPVKTFLSNLTGGSSVREALSEGNVPDAISMFVSHTFDVLASDDICQIASAFTLGREDLLPDLFQQLVAELQKNRVADLSTFMYYLQRHIDVDGDTHGPMAVKLLNDLCKDDASRWEAATNAAVEALQSRLQLWDAIAEQLPKTSC